MEPRDFVSYIIFTHKCKDSGGSYDTSSNADCDKNIGCEGVQMISHNVVNNSSGDIVFRAVGWIPRMKLILVRIMKFWAYP